MNLTRRDLLTTFLGAAAVNACQHAQAPPPIPGALLGPNVTRGHALRDDALFAQIPADLPVERVRAVVIGAGPAGLSAAWRLLRGGMTARDDVRILDLEDEAGGTSRSGESPVTRYPWGAHYVPVPSANARGLIALLDELGVVKGRAPDGSPEIAEEVLCRAPEERLYARGAWHEGLYLREGASADDLAQLHKFSAEVARWSRFRDARGRRAFAIPTAQASDDAEVLALDRESMLQWMETRGLRSPRLRWLVDYACRDDYGLALGETSAWAALFYFAARTTSDGRSAPLMTWPEGNGRLVRHLRESAGERLRLQEMVVDVSTTEDARVRVVKRDAKGKFSVLMAERVIVATPRFIARRIVRRLREAPAEPSPDYGSWVVANLHIRERPMERAGTPFAWDNVIYDSRSLGYVVATHQRGQDHGPTVLTWYYALNGSEGDGRAARERLMGATQHEWADVVLADLHRPHPDLAGRIERLDVWRWGHAMPRPRVGAREMLRKEKPWEAVGGMHFAHTDLSGIALFEEAHDHGVRAAEEVLEALKLPTVSLRE